MYLYVIIEKIGCRLKSGGGGRDNSNMIPVTCNATVQRALQVANAGRQRLNRDFYP